ncbi:LytTR family DNA-binding domain-containing protein [Mucilaginibacter sp. dw_454]|uniref:LytR/AlgR family response regulator transcription factor n=1 Tax=Mucilaginibacter sp. dw_454 TaxID=2720079 RepID=UPI001BD487F0|nr:LytTR family DNA-binding domain-containing protein [Mucilaginibacter sp. dw_454]
MTLKCIAVDDEPPALDLLCHYIGQTPFLNLSARFNNAIETLRYLGENEVDVLFLDVQMPDLSGIELARILSGRNAGKAPMIVFTTAFEQFALEGYKLDVIDYLLKPFSYEDFMRAANKALKLSQPKAIIQNITTPAIEDYIYLKVEFQTVKIACNNILYIEGLKDYAKFHLADTDKSLLSLITLKALEEKLPQGKFLRIHKSYIVSLDKITAVTRNAVYIEKMMIPVSEQYREAFNKFISNWS